MKCSTPFGIIGIRTRHQGRHLFHRRRCAQRLSASSEFAHKTMAEIKTSDECSTPFGIIGIRTLQ